MEQSRRNFIKTSSIASLGTVVFNFQTSCSTKKQKQETNSVEKLFVEKFKNPEATARPFFRWWWNGNKVEEEELVRELKIMQEAGGGGIEINPIALADFAQPLDIAEKEWLSEEWNQLLKKVAEEAKKFGLVTDLIVGTGWPFGGRFIAPEETLQGLKMEITPVKGGDKILKNLHKGDDEKIFACWLFPEEVDSLVSGKMVQWEEQPEGQILITVPEGNYNLHIISWRRNFREVLFGAPGGDGPVIDHFNKNAVEKYLNNMSQKLTKSFEVPIGNYIRSLFCDSIELEGANWTDDMETEFEQRRGYALQPWLPLILDKKVKIKNTFNAEIRKVRYDFSLTMAELFEERFIKVYHNWCKENGLESRYQAYGHPWLYTDLLDGYLIPDIPEGDQWLFNPGWQPYADINEIRYAVWNKYASSAGHIKGRKIISTEGMTNTSGVFEASLAYIKQASDVNFISGINHLVLHGFNYSSQETPFPGWIRFGTYFNEKNPWWHYMRNWSDYVSRISQVLQDSSPVSKIAIMGPTADIWADSGLDRNPFNLQPWYLHALWQALNHAGYCSDYINANILAESKVTSGVLNTGAMQYEILLIASVKTAKLETLKLLEKMAASGLKIVFIEHTPQFTPGKKEVSQQEFGNLKMRLLEQETVSVVNAPEDDLKTSQLMLAEWAANLINKCAVKPQIQFSSIDASLFFIQHQVEKKEIYFVVNTHLSNEIQQEVTFPSVGKRARKYHPETGEITDYPFRSRNGKTLLQLKPLESILLVLEEGKSIVEPESDGEKTKQATILNLNWKVTFYPVEGKSFEYDMGNLKDWKDQSLLKSFSGYAIYESEFQTEKVNGNEVIDLGNVREISEVWLNNEKLGSKWYGVHEYKLENALKVGNNKMKIKVTNLLFNYILSLKGRKDIDFWLNRAEQRRIRRNQGKLKPLSSGLLGPVQLITIS
ncbi:MAG: glycosyl hydrolase [Bacteroidota bacterium]